jgi:hypothetical protein
MTQELARRTANPAGSVEAAADDTRSLTRSADSYAARADAAWRLLAECPPDAVQWASLGYAAAHADLALEHARQLGIDGLVAARLARPFLALPRWGELSEMRSRPPTARCTAHCGHCSACVRAAAVESNMRKFGTLDFPGRTAVPS